MKKIFFLCVAIVAACAASAQQKGKTAYMSITINQTGLRLNHMVVTRTDSAQLVRDVKIKLSAGGIAKILSQTDDALMNLLKPYFNNGWKLVSVAEAAGNSALYHYYLEKEE